MNYLQKKNIRNVLRYTWPFYIVATIAVVLLMHIVFNITHKTPAYKTLTIFVSGEVVDSKKLKTDMLEKFKDKEIKSFSCISAKPEDKTYYSKLSIPGYNSADVLIIPISTLDNLNVSAFALEIQDELISSHYNGYSLYSQNEMNLGIKINKEKVSDYMTLPEEDCYMVLNAKSANTGDYSIKPVSEHDMALTLVKDWGM